MPSNVTIAPSDSARNLRYQFRLIVYYFWSYFLLLPLHSWPSIEKPKVENIGFGFGMVFLSSGGLQAAEIYVFPVWATVILGSDSL